MIRNPSPPGIKKGIIRVRAVFPRSRHIYDSINSRSPIMTGETGERISTGISRDLSGCQSQTIRIVVKRYSNIDSIPKWCFHTGVSSMRCVTVDTNLTVIISSRIHRQPLQIGEIAHHHIMPSVNNAIDIGGFACYLPCHGLPRDEDTTRQNNKSHSTKQVRTTFGR